jgi:hypothetical protein
LVIEPVVVKTVSYFKESVVRRSLASVVFMKESFLQEEASISKLQVTTNKKEFIFICQI